MSSMDGMDVDSNGSSMDQGDALSQGGPSGMPAASVTSELRVEVDSTRCGGCTQPFDGASRPPMTGQDGRTQCGDCWDSVGTLRQSFPITARDLLSPPLVDPPTAAERGAGAASNADDKMRTAATATVGTATGSATLQAAAVSTATAPIQAPATRVLTVPRRVVAAATVQPSNGDGDIATITVVYERTKVTLRVNIRTTTVLVLKKMIQTETGIAEVRQKLMHMGKPMSVQSKTLVNYGVSNGSRIDIAQEVAYGG